MMNTNTRRLVPALFFGTLLTAAAVFPQNLFAQNRSVWLHDFNAAEARAKREGKILLVHFYADWCGPCKKMDRETLFSPELARQMGNSVIGVKVNFDRNPQVARRFQVRSLPTDVFLGPTGRTLARTTGYQTKRQYLASVARIEGSFQTSRKTRVAKSPTENLRPKAKEVPNVPTARRESIIGMDGYSPVSLHQKKKWVRGLPKFTAMYQGVTYWLSSEAERKAFKADPRRYAPRLLGCDPVLLNQDDRAIPGKIDYGAFFDGELFFFVSAKSRETFRRNPLQYIQTRHVLRVEQIGGTVRR